MPKTRALLVGRSNDTELMMKHLAENLGVLPADIQVMPYEDTTAGEINTCLTQLIGGIPDGAVFYFSGPGCQMDLSEGEKTLVGDLMGTLDSVDSTLASEGYHEGSLIRTEVSNMMQRVKAIGIELALAKVQDQALQILREDRDRNLSAHPMGSECDCSECRCLRLVDAAKEGKP